MLSMGNFQVNKTAVSAALDTVVVPDIVVTMTPTTIPTGFDESVLVAQAKAGDQNAFGELVHRYERKIYRLAKNITRNDEDAEDVLQDAFLKAYTHLDNFKGDSKFYT